MERNPEFVHHVFSRIAPRYVAANHILSLGIDILWRKTVVQIVSAWSPARLLDVATGTGDLALALAKKLPDTQITGTDFCQPMLDIAAHRGVKNIVLADALHLPMEDGSFDALTVAFGLRNMEDYSRVLAEFRRVLVPGGHLLILDFSMPEGVLGTLYRPYLHHILPRIAGWLTKNPEAYTYLGDSIESFPRGEAMLSLLKDCGYENAVCRRLSFGIASIYTAHTLEV